MTKAARYQRTNLTRAAKMLNRTIRIHARRKDCRRLCASWYWIVSPTRDMISSSNHVSHARSYVVKVQNTEPSMIPLIAATVVGYDAGPLSRGLSASDETSTWSPSLNSPRIPQYWLYFERPGGVDSQSLEERVQTTHNFCIGT